MKKIKKTDLNMKGKTVSFCTWVSNAETASFGVCPCATRPPPGGPRISFKWENIYFGPSTFSVPLFSLILLSSFFKSHPIILFYFQFDPWPGRLKCSALGLGILLYFVLANLSVF